MRTVLPKQQYSLLIPGTDIRRVFEVRKIDGQEVHGILIESGVPRTVRLSVLAKGRCAVALVRREDGTPVSKDDRRQEVYERITPKIRYVAGRVAKGVRVERLAQEYGVLASTVRRWVAMVEREKAA